MQDVVFSNAVVKGRNERVETSAFWLFSLQNNRVDLKWTDVNLHSSDDILLRFLTSKDQQATPAYTGSTLSNCHEDLTIVHIKSNTTASLAMIKSKYKDNNMKNVKGVLMMCRDVVHYLQIISIISWILMHAE